MKKNTTIIFTILILCIFPNTLFSVDWPQEENTEKSISSYFAQNINGSLSTSLIFSEPADVKAVKEGRILIEISDTEDDSELFPSSLGTCVIIAHDDDLISVYSNLDKDSVNENLYNKQELKEGEIIGQTGNSGWQKDISSLEFQIIDTQKASAINPKILLPRIENEKEYTLSGIVLQNKEGTFYDLKEHKVFPSGAYKVYHTRNKIASPYKITTSINGVIVDEIFFDTISMQNGKLYVSGKKQYNSKDIFPDENLILSGELMLTSGKSTLTLAVENFLGKEKQVNYTLSIY